MAANDGNRVVVRVAGGGDTAQAVRAGNFLYTSGLVAPADSVSEEVTAIYATLDDVLEQLGTTWSDVVKVNYYTAPQESSREIAEAITACHAGHAGSNGCAITGAPLQVTPEGARVHIELIARPGSRRSNITTVAGVPAAEPWACAARADETLYASGQLPLPAGALPGPGAVTKIQGGLGEQALAAYTHHDRILQAAGMRWADAVQVHQFLPERKLDIDEFQRARHTYLTPGHYLSTSVACERDFPQWPVEGCLILVDMEADTRPRTPVQATGTWGNKPGPHGFWCGDILRMHGQVPRNLESKTQHPDDMERQTRMTYENLTAVLKAAGVSWSDVVLARTFCREAEHVAVARRIQSEWLDQSAVATTDLVAAFFDPLLLVEIELVAVRPG